MFIVLPDTNLKILYVSELFDNPNCDPEIVNDELPGLLVK